MEIKDFTKITVILRGYNYETVRNICLAVKETKNIRNLEITMNTPDVFEIISKISKEFGECLNIGAGTVTSLEQAKKAIESGAEFLLSPTVMGKDIVDYARERNVITVSGALTPSEVLTACENNSDIIKIFPVSNVCKSYFKDLKGPLGEFPIMAVGGVNRENAKDYFDRGAQYIGLGGLFSKESLKENNLDKMKKDCKEFEKLIFNE
ncbi:2-keto-3-deoxy-6-phosphogluconate aldolase [Clostridium sartagoforme AAU1]|uniref:2-keto-3-deoxy-6-phosphogluconate aldolase n=1 Tax=Clostridium sartagoforme AAU1 TaxID=1202534 RepID=R9CE30_9CLOT|nr:bifunctional 4-hydroxy-2-oxoglutarate aldolase/2-dehydro-3-deoxy-phosphogluconate aldolase [Clostridium sartagoforme]EOR27528.1 2-keto-3-deoxy-6-phosphogluconate aldolase [Clostridium sartagoforme AAU1]